VTCFTVKTRKSLTNISGTSGYPLNMICPIIERSSETCQLFVRCYTSLIRAFSPSARPDVPRSVRKRVGFKKSGTMGVGTDILPSYSYGAQDSCLLNFSLKSLWSGENLAFDHFGVWISAGDICWHSGKKYRGTLIGGFNSGDLDQFVRQDGFDQERSA
jgi:hypothetical protein